MTHVFLCFCISSIDLLSSYPRSKTYYNTCDRNIFNLTGHFGIKFANEVCNQNPLYWITRRSSLPETKWLSSGFRQDWWSFFILFFFWNSTKMCVCLYRCTQFMPLHTFKWISKDKILKVNAIEGTDELKKRGNYYNALPSTLY